MHVVRDFSSPTVDFDPGRVVNTHTNHGILDSFITKFVSDGTFHWVQTWGKQCLCRWKVRMCKLRFRSSVWDKPPFKQRRLGCLRQYCRWFDCLLSSIQETFFGYHSYWIAFAYCLTIIHDILKAVEVVQIG
jgi:hypothetical protein